MIEARYGFGLHKDQVDAGHRTTAFKVSGPALLQCLYVRDTNRRSGSLLLRSCTRLRLVLPSYRFAQCTFEYSLLQNFELLSSV